MSFEGSAFQTCMFEHVQSTKIRNSDWVLQNDLRKTCLFYINSQYWLRKLSIELNE